MRRLCIVYTWHEPLLATVRSAEDITARGDVSKICNWRIWRSVGTFSFSTTRDIVEISYYRQCVSNRGPRLSTVRQYWRERLGERTKHIPEGMKKNTIHLFNAPHKPQKTNTSGLVSSLKSDRNLISRLYVASVLWWQPQLFFLSREYTMSTISLRKDIVRCLEDALEEQDDKNTKR